jgi:hypothetical protein
MWDCHSCDPGSNPGPGVQPSVRIPTTIFIIDHKNNKDHIINSETTATISIVQQQQQQQNNTSSDKYKVAKLFENYQMRDLYNRKKKLDY